MSSDGSLTLSWGDGEYKFRLGIGEIRELQDKCDAGPGEIFTRLMRNTWRIDDVIQPLRLGLIGGGLDATKALAKVGKYITPGSIIDHVLPAAQVIDAALAGDKKDSVGKVDAAAAAATNTNETEDFNFRTSSEPPQPSAGQSTNSTGPAFGNSPPPSMVGIDATASKTNGQSL